MSLRLDLTKHFRRASKFQRGRRQKSSRRLIVESLEERRVLATVSWDGGGGDFNWSNPLNWDSDSLPGAADDVKIDFGSNNFTVVHSSGTDSVKSIVSQAPVSIAGGELYVTQDSLFNSSLLLQGTLISERALTVSGAFTWNGGTLRGANGQGTLTANGGTTITGQVILQGGFHYINPVAQTALWIPVDGVANGGTIILQDNSTFENAGRLELLGNAVMTTDSTSTSLLNSGTLVKLGGDSVNRDGSILLPASIVNSGVIDVRVGGLQLGFPGFATNLLNTGTIRGGVGTTIGLTATSSSSGVIDGDLLVFQGGSALVSGSYRANRTQLSGSNVTFTGAVQRLGPLTVGGSLLDLANATFAPGATTIESLNLNGVLITDEALTVSGAFTWNNGTLRGANGQGSLTLVNDLTVQNTLNVRDLKLINNAQMTWAGGTIQFYGSTGGFVNAAGAKFDDQIDGTFGSVDGNCVRFTNNGRFVKSGLTGITNLQMQLYNRGTVEIQQGQLFLGCGYVSTNPGIPIPPGITYPPEHPPIVEDPNPTPLPPASPPVVIPGSYTQTVTGQLIEQIAGYSGTGPYGTPGIDYGQMVVNGDLALNGTFQVQVIGGFIPTIGQKYLVIDNRGTRQIDGTFIDLPEGSIAWSGNFGFKVTYVGGTGNDFVLTMDRFAVAPMLTSVVVNGGDSFTDPAQRSEITSLVVTFSVPVVLSAGAFSISNIGLVSSQTPVALAASQIIVTGSGKTYTIRFGAGPGVITRATSTGLGRGNSLVDGNFVLSIDADKVAETMLGKKLLPVNNFGDGDNEFGDQAVDAFFRMFGDADGSGVVNSLDTGAFNRALTTYNAALDFDGDGYVKKTGVDYTNFLSNFNKKRRLF